MQILSWKLSLNFKYLKNLENILKIEPIEYFQKLLWRYRHVCTRGASRYENI
jgi:hypothetical protein